MNNKVVVIGGNHQNPLGVIVSLGRKGIKPYVIVLSDLKKSFVLKSKYIERGWICSKNEEVIKCLLQNFTDASNKAVMITCSDDTASLIDNNLNILKDYFFLPNAGIQRKITSWMNKEVMSREARLSGLMVPATWVLRKGESIQEVKYPCITKSMTSLKIGKGDFRLCNDASELKMFLETQKKSQDIQVQKFVDKDFEFQFIGCSLKAGQEIIIPGMTHIDITHSFNNLVFLKYVQIESSLNELLEKCHNYIKKIGYSGLFSLEFIRGKDGKNYFLEMNFRNDGNAFCVTSSGINLPYIWYLFNVGGNYKVEIEQSSIKQVYSVPEDSYFLSMVNGEVSYREWKNNMKKVNSYITYFKEDRRPFYALMRLQCKVIIKSIGRRLLKELRLLN
ncbi:ATP-grasp domain-containing protein [Oceanihabitans sediminis]|uniref:ATP-grasp domain-containing protein n=1 Tax=Oceanihabitans sediminis TaxID=1812012 RepID=UPI003A91EF33